MPSCFRLSAVLLAPICCLLSTAPGAEDSPIMQLDEVIGIEVHRLSMNDKMKEEGKRYGLLADNHRESGFSLIRKFDHEAVRFRSIQTRMVKGGWANAMTIVPKGSGPFPAVFLLDEECRYLRFPGIRPLEMEADDFEGPIYARIPLVSHLVGSGFAAAMSTPKTLSKNQGTMTDRDWIALIKLFKAESRIDQESLFLVATYEFAELAVRLAVQFRFAGVVIEAPREMMFVRAAARAERKKQDASGKSADQADPSSADDQENSVDTGRKTYFQSETHVLFYAEHARMLKTPTLVILAKEAPEFDQTRQTFLAALAGGKADFSVVLLDRWARTLISPGEQAETWIPSEEETRGDSIASGRPGGPTRFRGPFRYEDDQFGRWVTQMDVFLVSHSSSKPQSLRPPQLKSRGMWLEDAFGQSEGGPTTGSRSDGNEDGADPSLPDPNTGY